MKRKPKYRAGDVVRLPFTPMHIRRGKQGAFTTISTGHNEQVRVYDLAEITKYNSDSDTYCIKLKGVTNQEGIEVYDIAAEFIDNDCTHDTIETMKNNKK